MKIRNSGGRIVLAAALLAASAFATGCGSSVKLALKNAKAITATTSAQAQSKYNLMAAGDQTSTVTIESLKLPIADVGFSAGDNLYGDADSGYVYSCGSSSVEDCEVELVGPALENLLTGGDNGGDLDSGTTYNSVMIGTCVGDAVNTSKYKVKIKAKALVGGTTYYTKTGSAYLTATESEYSPVEIEFNGCRNYTVFSQPLNYTGGDVTVNLFIDLRDIAQVYGTSSTLYNNAASGNCTVEGTPSGAPYLCLDYPSVAGTLSTGAPTIERYKLVNTAAAGTLPTLIGFYFDADGNAIGGYTRPWLTGSTTETQLPSVPATFKKASIVSSKLTMTDYSGGTADSTLGTGTSVTNQASTNGDFNVADFPRPATASAGAQALTATKADGSAVSGTFQVTRIDD